MTERPTDARRRERRNGLEKKAANPILFALPMAPSTDSEIVNFWLAALNNRPYVHNVGQYVALAHNLMIDTARDANRVHREDTGRDLWDWLGFVEHDHDFDWQGVWAAVEEYDYRETPVVAHLYPTRSYPVVPVGYNYDPEEKAYTPISEDQIRFWKEIEPGLHRADGVPMGLTFIHKTVFDRLDEVDPEGAFFAAPVGKRGIYGMSDDMYFSKRCTDAGIPLHFDTRFDIGHWGKMRFSFVHYFAQQDAIHRMEEAKAADTKPKIEIVKAIEVPKLASIGGKP